MEIPVFDGFFDGFPITGPSHGAIVRGREASHGAAREVHGVPVAKSNLETWRTPGRNHGFMVNHWNDHGESWDKNGIRIGLSHFKVE